MGSVESAHARAQESAFELIALDRIDPSKTNPRKSFNDKKLGELAESIRRLGIAEPLIVRPHKKRYELVAGERRLRAAKIAGVTTVPCMVCDLSDTEALEIQVIENDQREDVHPLEQMDGYQRLLDTAEYGGDRAKLAERIGKSVSFIHQRLKLREASDQVQQAFREGRIKSHHAVMIAREPAPAQEGLLRLCLDRGWSTRELQEHILRDLRRDVAKGGFDADDAGLLPSAPACSACPKLAGNCAELHDDAKSPTSCTDVECYQRKQQAYLERAIAGAKERGEELLQIKVGWEYWGKQPKGVLDDGDYVRIGGKVKKCDETRKAIIVHGEGTGKIVSVCASPKCKAHKGQVSPSAEKRREDQRKAEAEKRLLNVVCGRLVDALLDNLSVIPEGTLIEFDNWWLHRLEEWAEEWWERLWNDRKVRIRKRHPEWDADTIPVGDLTPAELVRFVNEIALSGHLDIGWGSGLPKELCERCECYDIDWRAIEADVRAAAAQKGKKAPKGKALAETLAGVGVTTDTGSVIEFRAKAKGPVLARIQLTREPKRLIHKHGGASTDDLGFFVDVTMRFPGFVLAHRVQADEGLHSEAWASTSAALVEAYNRIVGWAMLIPGEDAKLTADWAELRLIALGGRAIRSTTEARGPEGDASPWALVARLLAMGPSVWPEANEHGVFDPTGCVIVDAGLKDCSARVYLVQTEQGWRESFDVDLEGIGGAYPSARGKIYPSVSAALMGGLDGISSKGGQNWTGKAKKQWAAVRDWLVALYGEAAKVVKDEAEATAAADGFGLVPDAAEVAEDLGIETPASTDQTVSQMERCEKCGVWVTPGGMAAHLVSCEEAK